MGEPLARVHGLILLRSPPTPRGRRANRRPPRASDQEMPDLQCDCESPGEVAPGGTSALVDAGTIPHGAAGGRAGDPAGTLKSEEEGPNPPGGVTPGPVPVLAYGPGPERCAEAGTAIASAAIIATPLKKCFITSVLRCIGLVRDSQRSSIDREILMRISNVLLSLGNALADPDIGRSFSLRADEIFALLCSAAGLTFQIAVYRRDCAVASIAADQPVRDVRNDSYSSAARRSGSSVSSAI